MIDPSLTKPITKFLGVTKFLDDPPKDISGVFERF